MYSKLPNLVLGFHGCSKDTFERVIHQQEELRRSENAYDWLGHGIYFWEQNFARAQEWAEKRYGKEDARVIGAVIDLGYCLNLTDSSAVAILKQGYRLLTINCLAAGLDMPTNKPSRKTSDILLRDLDCAVIQQIHDFKKMEKLPEYDSVRGVFTEGDVPYPGSAFQEKTHIQLCIRNPNCIKGYFRPLSRNSQHPLP